jgi:hypothetical protein
MATLTDQVWTYLIAQSIVRDPRVAGPLPPAWRQPVDGVPAPGEGVGVEVGATAVIGLVKSGGIPSPRFEKEWRRDIIDIWFRTSKWPAAETLYAQVRSALIDKRNWTMGTIKVIESLEWRPHQLLDTDSAQGFTSHSAVLFETYTADTF